MLTFGICVCCENILICPFVSGVAVVEAALLVEAGWSDVVNELWYPQVYV